jgi:hypothetical protein
LAIEKITSLQKESEKTKQLLKKLTETNKIKDVIIQKCKNEIKRLKEYEEIPEYRVVPTR